SNCRKTDVIREKLVKKQPALFNWHIVIFLQDNARSHKVSITVDKLNSLKYKPLPQPPYSPEISPTDYYLFDFTHACISAAELSVRKSSGIVSKKGIPWFNNECKAKTRAYKKAFRKYKKYKTEHLKIEYKKARAEARRLLKESQRNAWRQFTASINHQTPTSIVWKKIRSISNKSSAIIPPVIKNLNNIPISDLSDKCNILAEAFAMNSSDNNHKEEFTRLKTVFRSTLEMNLNSPSNLDNDPINSPFTISELLHVITLANSFGIFVLANSFCILALANSFGILALANRFGILALANSFGILALTNSFGILALTNSFACRVIKQLVTDEGQNNPLAIDPILMGSYVDVISGGADTIEQLNVVASQLQNNATLPAYR
ncbi:hypothetical protein M0802_014664, partial [Mischocyttarus mexicanus]